MISNCTGIHANKQGPSEDDGGCWVRVGCVLVISFGQGVEKVSTNNKEDMK